MFNKILISISILFYIFLIQVKSIPQYKVDIEKINELNAISDFNKLRTLILESKGMNIN